MTRIFFFFFLLSKDKKGDHHSHITDEGKKSNRSFYMVYTAKTMSDMRMEKLLVQLAEV